MFPRFQGIAQDQVQALYERFRAIIPGLTPETLLLKASSEPLLKADETTHLSFGPCTSEAVDSDGELADYSDTKAELQKWSDISYRHTVAAGQKPSRGNLRIMHGLETGGKIIDLQYDDEAKKVYAAGEPKDDATWQQVANGIYTSYSIGGGYRWRKCNDCGTAISSGRFCPTCARQVVVRYAPAIAEISWVDRPANPEAYFDYVKADGSKTLRKFVKAGVTTATGYNFYAQGGDKDNCPKCGGKALEPGDGHNGEMCLCNACKIEWTVTKAARTPLGTFTPKATGEVDDIMTGYGYTHERTGTDTRHGASTGHPTLEGGTVNYQAQATLEYAGPGGATLVYRADGNWTWNNGHGATVSGSGLDQLAAHMEVKGTKKAQTIKTVAAAEKFAADNGFKLVKTAETFAGLRLELIPDTAEGDIDVNKAELVELLKADREQIIIQLTKTIDERFVALRLAKDADGDDDGDEGSVDVECPHCHREFQAPSGTEDMECPHCGEDVDVEENEKAAKASKALHATVLKFEDAFRAPADDDLSRTASKLELLLGKTAETPDPDRAKMRKRRRDVLLPIIKTALSAGSLQKSMYTVASLASILEGLTGIAQSVTYEGTWEKDPDDAELAARLKVTIGDLIEILKDLLEEETEESLQGLEAAAVGLAAALNPAA